MNVSDFEFDLPDELIAQHAAPRGESRLLVLDRATGARRHTTIADLPSILVPGDVLAVNNTRVFAARLLGHRIPSGGAVECLLLGPAQPSNSTGAETRDVNQQRDVWIAEALMHPGQSHAHGPYQRLSFLHAPSSKLPSSEQRSRPINVPSTSVYSRLDGIVAWQACVEPETALHQNVEVRCSHVGFGVDPATLWLIADRLARPAGRQVPFRPPLSLRPLYPRPAQDPR